MLVGFFMTLIDWTAVSGGWNRLYSRYPEAIVFCSEAQDVVKAVEIVVADGSL
jgi:FAD/FMN-containing dehydrogenase